MNNQNQNDGRCMWCNNTFVSAYNNRHCKQCAPIFQQQHRRASKMLKRIESGKEHRFTYSEVIDMNYILTGWSPKLLRKL